MSPHALSWFEISVTDFARACTFYEALLDATLEIHDMGDVLMALLPVGEGGIGGALQYDKDALPSEHGTVVYLDAGADLQAMLDRVEPAGGRVTMPKALIPGDFGYYALFTDSEGNRVGLMSPS